MLTILRMSVRLCHKYRPIATALHPAVRFLRRPLPGESPGPEILQLRALAWKRPDPVSHHPQFSRSLRKPPDSSQFPERFGLPELVEPRSPRAYPGYEQNGRFELSRLFAQAVGDVVSRHRIDVGRPECETNIEPKKRKSRSKPAPPS